MKSNSPISLPSQSRLKSLFTYDVDSGVLSWKIKPVYSRSATTEVRNKSSSGYLTVKVDGKRYQVHRLIWKLVTGRDPKNEIDHINRNREDNRICNLREVTREENRKNLSKFKNNSSGVPGVSWHRLSGKWQAYIRLKNIQMHLGLFDSFEEAVAARQKAEKRWGFSGQ